MDNKGSEIQYTDRSKQKNKVRYTIENVRREFYKKNRLADQTIFATEVMPIQEAIEIVKLNAYNQTLILADNKSSIAN